MPQLASARIKRWSLLLATYDYTIEFIPGKENVYADFLSRKPVAAEPSSAEQVWWSVLDKEIEETVKFCTINWFCNSPASSQPASWSWPGGPWKRLHLDFAGPYLVKTFLVIVDAYSKFLELVPMSHATSANTIAALRHVFSYFGLPEHLVTDNGSQFTSAEFQKFLRDNDIEHTITAPGHPATNGLAERYVGEFKDKLNKIGDTGEPLQTKLDRFLLTHRATPTSFGKSPSELLMNRQPRIRLSALRSKSTKQEVKGFQDNHDNKPKFTPVSQFLCVILGKEPNGYLEGLQKDCKTLRYSLHIFEFTLLYKIKINVFLPEMLCVVVLVADFALDAYLSVF